MNQTRGGVCATQALYKRWATTSTLSRAVFWQGTMRSKSNRYISPTSKTVLVNIYEEKERNESESQEPAFRLEAEKTFISVQRWSQGKISLFLSKTAVCWFWLDPVVSGNLKKWWGNNRETKLWGHGKERITNSCVFLFQQASIQSTSKIYFTVEICV